MSWVRNDCSPMSTVITPDRTDSGITHLLSFYGSKILFMKNYDSH